MTRGDGKSRGKDGAVRTKKRAALTLLRVEPADSNGITLVFESSGEEMGWLLEQTSVTEFLALLLRGRMRKGRRIELDAAEVTIEPPGALDGDPFLCVAMGPLELCAPVNRATVKAMKLDLDRATKRPH